MNLAAECTAAVRRQAEWGFSPALRAGCAAECSHAGFVCVGEWALLPLPPEQPLWQGQGAATAHIGGLSLLPNFLRLNQIHFLMDCYLNYHKKFNVF